MRVLFVYSVDNAKLHGSPLRSWSDMQHGISYISSLLKSNGHETSLLVLGSNIHRKSLRLLKEAVAEFEPALVCFTSVYSQHQFIEKLARFTKQLRPATYSICGGVHTTLKPHEVIEGPFDAICIGEGEFPVLELCNELEAGQTPKGIANLWIKSGGEVQRNAPRGFLQDLDLLPLPDYEMWRPWIEEPKNDVMTVFGGRGCPYDCTYCSNHALRKVSPGRYVRTRSPESIVEEVKLLHASYPHREIYFEIETLDCDISWTIELCNRLQTFNDSISDRLSFGSNYRINPHTINEAVFSALGKANFTSINIGLESGSERVRRDVLKRNYSNGEFLEVVSLARRHGLKVFVYNMIGLPEESLEDHRETVRLNRLCQPDGHHTGIFHPYPGTELHDVCVNRGLLDGASKAGRERRRSVLNLPRFSKSQIQSAYTWFDYHVYKNHKPLPQIVLQVALVKIDSDPVAKYLYQRAIYPLQVVRRLARRIFG